MHQYWNEQMSLEKTLAEPLFERVDEPWQVLPLIHDFVLEEIERKKDDPEYVRLQEDILVHRSVSIAPTASLNGPLLVEEGTEIRPGAFIRGNALVGKNCVVGNSTELKNVILFDRVQVPHYNYVGDSVLGYRAHMGAGSITSNVKSDRTPVVLHPQGTETGLKKMGAILCDETEIGCNSVLNPGTIIEKGSTVYPLSSVRVRVPAFSIYKGEGNIVRKRDA